MHDVQCALNGIYIYMQIVEMCTKQLAKLPNCVDGMEISKRMNENCIFE